MRNWTSIHREIELGRAEGSFQRVADALLSWEVHRRAGLSVSTDDPVREGQRADLRIGWKWFTVTAPVEITEVLTGQGFTYRALPGHPEEGDETFLVEQRADGMVTFTVSATSRPATWWARLGGPVTRLVQRRVTTAYLQAAQALARGESA